MGLIAIISSFSIVLSSRKSKVEKLLEEVKSTTLLKSVLLINCVITIVAIILGHIQSSNIDAFYTPASFLVLMCYVHVSEGEKSMKPILFSIFSHNIPAWHFFYFLGAIAIFVSFLF